MCSNSIRKPNAVGGRAYGSSSQIKKPQSSSWPGLFRPITQFGHTAHLPGQGGIPSGKHVLSPSDDSDPLVRATIRPASFCNSYEQAI